MSDQHRFDTVAFDVRGSTAMLMFAKTGDDGDIEDYLLIMKSVDDDFDEIQTIERNEEQVSGKSLITEARLVGNTLGLSFSEAVSDWQGVSEMTLCFADNEQNHRNLEAGAFQILASVLIGGSA